MNTGGNLSGTEGLFYVVVPLSFTCPSSLIACFSSLVAEGGQVNDNGTREV